MEKGKGKKKSEYLPSPNPKHGIKLSSSKGDSVRPIIEMACSYGFGMPLMACRDFLLKECLPTEIQQNIYLFKPTRILTKTARNLESLEGHSRCDHVM